jgi:hypothetical protein
MSDELHSEIEIGSNNIFADLDLDNADELYTRACLCHRRPTDYA